MLHISPPLITAAQIVFTDGFIQPYFTVNVQHVLFLLGCIFFLLFLVVTFINSLHMHQMDWNISRVFKKKTGLETTEIKKNNSIYICIHFFQSVHVLAQQNRPAALGRWDISPKQQVLLYQAPDGYNSSLIRTAPPESCSLSEPLHCHLH